MNFFENPEIKNITITHMVVAAAGAGLCVKLGYFPMPAIVVAATTGLLWLIGVGRSNRKYENLKNISLELDKLLHGKKEVDFATFTEGELSAMENRLEKVVLKLHRQRDDLQREKLNLTNSIADISHQLRTPLTSINLIIDLMKRQELPDSRRIQMAIDLQKLSDRIDWLINALLKISKIDAGTADFHNEKVHISRLIRKRAGPLEIGMDLKDQRLEFIRQGDEFFTGDISWTAEAIGNILKNCSEHTPPGGCITVKTEQTAVYTQLEIYDSGPGFAAEDIPHLFTRFYKGKNSLPDSVGIGLALARMIIVNQNGTIKADNHPAGGARFTVKFYHSVV